MTFRQQRTHYFRIEIGKHDPGELLWISKLLHRVCTSALWLTCMALTMVRMQQVPVCVFPRVTKCELTRPPAVPTTSVRNDKPSRVAFDAVEWIAKHTTVLRALD